MKSSIRLQLILTLTFCLPSFLILAQISNSKLPSSTEEKTAKKPIAEILFEELEYDFGTITSGEKVKRTYTFTNTGEVPLVLTNAKGSCGCTVPSWPAEPILPGETGTIEVTFDSKNKSGRQSKRVTITANTNPAQTFLTIKGDLVKSEEVIEKEASTPPIGLVNENLETNKKNCFAIFPNPTSDVLKLDLKENIGKQANIRIYSPQGKLLLEKKIRAIESIVEFDVSNYAAGTYIANVQIEGQVPMAHCFVIL